MFRKIICKPLTSKQIDTLPLAPMQPVFRRKLRRDESGKIQLNALNQPIYDQIPVMEYDPSTGTKIQKQRRVHYTNSQLMDHFYPTLNR